MPLLYKYLGIDVFFYSNEHDPVHVHGKYGSKQCKAEILIEQGQIIEIRVAAEARRPMLTGKQLADFETLVRARADEIVQKWIDYFVLHNTVTPEVITQRLS